MFGPKTVPYLGADVLEFGVDRRSAGRPDHLRKSASLRGEQFMTRPIFYGSLRRQVTLAAVCTLPMLWVIVASVGGQTRTAPADLLITNGKVYAADGTGRFYQAVAVGSGKVLRVGSNQEVVDLRGPSTNVIDARGRVVVPGFNDSHVHFLGGGSA